MGGSCCNFPEAAARLLPLGTCRQACAPQACRQHWRVRRRRQRTAAPTSVCTLNDEAVGTARLLLHCANIASTQQQRARAMTMKSVAARHRRARDGGWPTAAACLWLRCACMLLRCSQSLIHRRMLVRRPRLHVAAAGQPCALSAAAATPAAATRYGVTRWSGERRATAAARLVAAFHSAGLRASTRNASPRGMHLSVTNAVQTPPSGR